MRLLISLAIFLATCSSTIVNAQVFYTEATSGDLGDPVDSSPSILGLLGLGLNTVNGSLDNTATILDRDAFTFTVASEQQLDCLLYTSPSPRDATLSRMPSSA